jgi:hypothetical protein
MSLFQGDGESVPETPPNEEANLKPAASAGVAAAAAEVEPAFKLRFEVDGVATVLFVVSVLTRLFRDWSTIFVVRDATILFANVKLIVLLVVYLSFKKSTAV